MVADYVFYDDKNNLADLFKNQRMGEDVDLLEKKNKGKNIQLSAASASTKYWLRGA